MDSLSVYWEQGDAIGRAVAIGLLVMSVLAWVVIFWKGWLLRRARRDLGQHRHHQQPDGHGTPDGIALLPIHTQAVHGDSLPLC